MEARQAPIPTPRATSDGTPSPDGVADLAKEDSTADLDDPTAKSGKTGGASEGKGKGNVSGFEPKSEVGQPTATGAPAEKGPRAAVERRRIRRWDI